MSPPNYPTDRLMKPHTHPAFSFPSFPASLLGPSPASLPCQGGAAPEAGGEGQGDGQRVSRLRSQLGQAQSQVKWAHFSPLRRDGPGLLSTLMSRS